MYITYSGRRASSMNQHDTGSLELTHYLTKRWESHLGTVKDSHILMGGLCSAGSSMQRLVVNSRCISTQRARDGRQRESGKVGRRDGAVRPTASLVSRTGTSVHWTACASSPSQADYKTRLPNETHPRHPLINHVNDHHAHSTPRIPRVRLRLLRAHPTQRASLLSLPNPGLQSIGSNLYKKRG